MIRDRKTVFIVDDDITNLTVGDKALSEIYNVFTISSGALLLKLLGRCIPDIILLDVEMPDMNGYETIKRLKGNKETRHIPVIFVTAKSDEKSELEGLSLGAIDYIVKPFIPLVLLKRIEVHLLVESQRIELSIYNDNLQKIVEDKTKTVVELQNAILKTMAELVECRDDVTGGHIERTQGYLCVLLDAMKERGLYANEMSSWELDQILQSTQLHDVGKIAIRDIILKKPGKLTTEEFETIKEHTTFGEEIIDSIKSATREKAFFNYAKIFAGTHHENWNGTGYPRGLKGEEIPLLGRLMAIVDVYDALVSERPYKDVFTHSDAVEIITEGRGTHFDPALVDLFLDVSEDFNQITLNNRNKSVSLMYG